MFRASLLLIALVLAAYTQLAHLSAIPGLHFDEAWQGVYAHRIASEPGFWPLQAMNSYTGPVIHYLLAGVFKVFGPTLAAMRGTYAALNFASLALLLALLWRANEKRAMAWLALLWALLPLSVHDHRFYVEMTGFHGFCLALVLTGLSLWNRRPRAALALTFAGIVAGTYCHILFISVFAGGIYALAQAYPREFRSKRARFLVGVAALALLPLTLRMGWGLKKALPFALSGALALASAWAALDGRTWSLFPRFARRLKKWLFLASAPFLVGYVLLMWNGSWPYAQATGHLRTLWLPLNAALFIALMCYQLGWIKLRRRVDQRNPVTERERYLLSPQLVWNGFLVTFAISSAITLKQSPRYYMIPTMLAMLWCAQRLGRLRRPAVEAILAISFTAFNLWAFESAYVRQFERLGSNTQEFRIAFYHDNGRDFRPFQKAFAWAVSTNCQQELRWVEDDRFVFPVEFLRLTAPAPIASCPWKRDDLFFSHIDAYDPAFAEPRTEFNTAPPLLAPHVKLLAHSPDWGDLAFWIRKPVK